MHRPTWFAGLVLLALVLMFATGGAAVAAANDEWPYWGGPNRDFKTDSIGLADRWPEGGPPVLWSRDLGEGYSAIAVRDGVLYTLYRAGEREIAIALDAASGETVWETSYESASSGWNFDRGAGPHATPAIAGDRVFTVGATGVFHALRRADGAILWTHDLMKDFDATRRNRGYSSSPLVFDDLVLVHVGGASRTVICFRQQDGEVVWRSGDDDNSYSSPTLIELAGRPQLVAFGANEIVGLDPASGAQLWSHPHPTRNAFNISTPLFSDDGLLFVSSAYDGGGRVLRLTAEGDATTVEELWFSNQMRVHFGTAIRLGDTVYASSGDFGPAPLTAVDIHSGDILWRDRSFKKHSSLYADGKLVLLDEDGVLGLVEVSPDGVKVLSQAQVFDSLAWTVPTLVGTRLYIRNRVEIKALELGSS